MSLRKTAFWATIASGLGAALLTEFTTAHELFTQAVVAFSALLAAGLIILILLFSPLLRKNRPKTQRRLIWVAGCSVAITVCFALPKMFAAFWH